MKKPLLFTTQHNTIEHNTAAGSREKGRLSIIGSPGGRIIATLSFKKTMTKTKTKIEKQTKIKGKNNNSLNRWSRHCHSVITSYSLPFYNLFRFLVTLGNLSFISIHNLFYQPTTAFGALGLNSSPVLTM